MKKIFLLIIISLFFKTLAFPQSKNQFLLTWKIAKNDTLKYKTVMDVINQTTQDTTVKENVFESLSKSLSALNSNIKYQTNLFLNKNNGNYIDIEMKIVDDVKNQTTTTVKESMPKPEKIKKDNEVARDSSFKSLYKSLAASNKNVVLRGRITTTGEIISSFYKSAQTNLIAMFYQLPNRAVTIGEKWKLDVQLISMYQNFLADSSSKDNYAYIEKIINEGGEQIAIVKYNLNEFISGNFNNPIAEKVGIGKGKDSTLKMFYTAIGQFSVTKGKWISYEGKLDTQNSFALFGGKSITIYKLVE